VVVHRDIVLVSLLSNGHPGRSVDVLIGPETDALMGLPLYRRGGHPLGSIEVQVESGVGEDRAGIVTVNVHRKLVHRLGSIGTRVVYAATFRDRIALRGKAGQRRLGVKRLTIVELDPLALLEAPGIGIYLLPAGGGAGGHNTQVIPRLPG
jgi:hypothetical protein